jgi:hypothetical protein
MKIVLKTGDNVDLDINDEGVKGFVKLEGFELEIDATWMDIERKVRSLRNPVPRKARGEGRVMSMLEQAHREEQSDA